VGKAPQQERLDGIVPGGINDGFVGEDGIGLAAIGKAEDENNNQNERLQTGSSVGFTCRASTRIAECFRSRDNGCQPLRPLGNSQLGKEVLLTFSSFRGETYTGNVVEVRNGNNVVALN
jgi:hypothetical protein